MPPPSRPLMAQALSGVHPECESFFHAYKLAHRGVEPTLEEMVGAMRRRNVPRSRATRDWRRLSSQLYVVRR